MPERITTLVKLIADTRPVQTARRHSLIGELRALRNDLDSNAVPEQVHSLDAAILLMEFMSRSEDVATADTIQIVASLVGTVDERHLRHNPARLRALPPMPEDGDVTEHKDLRLTQEFLLGSILLQAGVISPESLTRALHLHTSSGLAVGQCLIQLGAATAEQIASAVAYQDGLRDEEGSTQSGAAPAAHSGPHESTRSDLHMTAKQRGIVKSIHSQVLGEVLVRLGSISREQLDRALQVQRAANIHIGEALVEGGAASWDQIKRGLDIQKQLRRAA